MAEERDHFVWRPGTPDQPRPSVDPLLAIELLGSRVLIGMTYYLHDGSFSHKHQFFGTVASVTDDVVAIRLEGQDAGRVLDLPSDVRSLRRAEPGSYRLRITSSSREPCSGYAPSVVSDAHPQGAHRQ